MIDLQGLRVRQTWFTINEQGLVSVVNSVSQIILVLLEVERIFLNGMISGLSDLTSLPQIIANVNLMLYLL